VCGEIELGVEWIIFVSVRVRGWGLLCEVRFRTL